jgi:hypothetical protein
MAIYSPPQIGQYLNNCDQGMTNHAKGKAWEDLTCYLFGRIPGISITQRNTLNAFDTEEIDVALWNDQHKKGLFFLPNIILIECKNWSTPVSSIEVNWFVTKLDHRGQNFGILVAANGITGNPQDVTRANQIISTSLSRGIKIVVIRRNEIVGLNNTNEIVSLLKGKLCELAVAGTAF